jgi:hypothetical protein
MWDSEYSCAPFVLKTADIAADKLVRLRSNLCLWSAPPPYSLISIYYHVTVSNFIVCSRVRMANKRCSSFQVYF